MIFCNEIKAIFRFLVYYIYKRRQGNMASLSALGIKPELIRWARERAGLPLDALKKRFPKIELWEKGIKLPTISQLESFATKCRVPFGYLFLEVPPEESLPIPDFRTISRTRLSRPSADLLDTIYTCQQRQTWYREYMMLSKQKSLSFVGKAHIQDSPIEVASIIRNELNLTIHHRNELSSWQKALQKLVEQSESIDILVMISSIVGSNTHRKLNPEEFRGFVLMDDLAPLIFINGADSRAAQIFSLAHEIAHVWLGQSGISNIQIAIPSSKAIERWCNQVAAELLVPLEELKGYYNPYNDFEEELEKLARYFKVSTIVIILRLFDIGALNEAEFLERYTEENERAFQREKAKKGGDFYRNLNIRVSKPFAEALVSSTLEGSTLFTEAYRLLSIKNPRTFEKLAYKLGICLLS